MSPAELPIGIFDSGVGGLTVLKALRARLPNEDFLYLGDTARLPYGTKGPETVSRYAVQAAGHLVERGIKLLVVACNTASAMALPALTTEFAPLPVVGVVEPAAAVAAAMALDPSEVEAKWENQADWRSLALIGGSYPLAVFRTAQFRRSRPKRSRVEEMAHSDKYAYNNVACERFGSDLIRAVCEWLREPDKGASDGAASSLSRRIEREFLEPR